MTIDAAVLKAWARLWTELPPAVREQLSDQIIDRHPLPGQMEDELRHLHATAGREAAATWLLERHDADPAVRAVFTRRRAAQLTAAGAYERIQAGWDYDPATNSLGKPDGEA